MFHIDESKEQVTPPKGLAGESVSCVSKNSSTYCAIFKTIGLYYFCVLVSYWSRSRSIFESKVV